jgi:amino acid transporter
MQSHRFSISWFSLTLLLVSSILSISSWHIAAQFGFSAISYLIAATLLFMVPVAFVSAELASSYHHYGGLYQWIEDAFGMKSGMLCAWLLWVSNIVWYPTVFTFISTSFLYYFYPDFASNRLMTFAVMNLLFWSGNLLNIIGYKFSSRLLSLSVLFSMIIPAALLVVFCAMTFHSGLQTEVLLPETISQLLPTGQKGLVLFTGLLLGFTGMEMAMVHYEKVRDPAKNFPKAIGAASLFLILVSIMGSLGISRIVPESELNLITDSFLAIHHYLKIFHASPLMPVVNLMIAIGTWMAMSAYLAEPSKAFLQAVKSSGLSRQLEKSNSYSIPITIMLLQGGIVTLISCVFALFKNPSDFYWMLTDLASQLYLVIYTVMFLAVIKLKVVRKVYPITIIPFRSFGVCVLAILGIGLCLFSFLMGCLPAAESSIDFPIVYSLSTVSFIFIMTVTPLIGLKIKRMRKKYLDRQLEKIISPDA